MLKQAGFRYKWDDIAIRISFHIKISWIWWYYDTAVYLGMTDVGYAALTKNIIMAFTKRAMAVMLENNIDRMKISTQDVDLVL